MHIPQQEPKLAQQPQSADLHLEQHKHPQQPEQHKHAQLLIELRRLIELFHRQYPDEYEACQTDEDDSEPLAPLDEAGAAFVEDVDLPAAGERGCPEQVSFDLAGRIPHDPQQVAVSKVLETLLEGGGQVLHLGEHELSTVKLDPTPNRSDAFFRLALDLDHLAMTIKACDIGKVLKAGIQFRNPPPDQKAQISQKCKVVVQRASEENGQQVHLRGGGGPR
jgi:hypothetical protein